MRRHTGDAARAALLFLLATSGCDCGGESRERGDGGPDAEGDGGATSCSDGEFRCEGNVAISCGPAATRSDCTREGKSCADGVGCAECTPGTRSCAGGMATFCREDGTLARYECDPEQGLSCTAAGCVGECDLSNVYQSYIGCDYYPTMTLNPVWSGFSFAIAISNTSSQATNVLVTRGANEVRRTTVPPNALVTVELPWVAELKGGDITCTQPPSPGSTRLVDDGAYRVRSDHPVTVYQFSPLEYAKANPAPAACPTIKSQCATSLVEQCFSYSNDASLLLPATALTGSYTALTWPSQSDGAGFVTITATENGTRVDLAGTGNVQAGAGVNAVGSGVVMLDRGDVLEVVAANDADISGTRVRADKPVQLIAGHSCAYVPSASVQNCDHLEEVVFPEDTLGSEYYIARPVHTDGATPVPYVVRVGAIASGTTVSFDPKVRDDLTLEPGRFVELVLPTGGDAAPNLHVKGTKPLVVTTYMEGQAALPMGSNQGDPSMSTAVPVAQYRTSYLFTAPVTYDVNIASIVAKRGTIVRVDGQVVAESSFTPIGQSGYGVANVLLDLGRADSGIHEVSASAEVGLTVYGYGQYTSYMYPGGANLERITQPVLYL